MAAGLPHVAPHCSFQIAEARVFWLKDVSLHFMSQETWRNTHAAILIALRTLCQLLRTNATAVAVLEKRPFAVKVLWFRPYLQSHPRASQVSLPTLTSALPIPRSDPAAPLGSLVLVFSLLHAQQVLVTVLVKSLGCFATRRTGACERGEVVRKTCRG